MSANRRRSKSESPSLDKIAKCAIGVDLGSTNLRVGLVRDDGKILRLLRGRAVQNGSQGAGSSVHQLASLVREVLASPEASAVSLDGLGIGVGGQVNRQGEIVGTNGPRHQHWETVPFRRLAEQELLNVLPVRVDNDSKVAAWGEYLFGAGRGTDCMICLTIGTGVGGGIVLNGKLLHGASGLAGHLGFVSVDMHGPRCPSGVVGCVERYASGAAMTSAAREALRSGRKSEALDLAQGNIDAVTSPMIFEAARHGDSLAKETVRDAAYALGVAIATLLHVFDPDVVVVGGGVAEQGDVFLDPVRRTVEEFSMLNFAGTPIKAAELGNLAGVVGAAALYW